MSRTDADEERRAEEETERKEENIGAAKRRGEEGASCREGSQGR